mgnify:CR=1 FL=1
MAKVVLENKTQILDDETVHNLIVRDLLVYTSDEKKQSETNQIIKEIKQILTFCRIIKIDFSLTL